MFSVRTICVRFQPNVSRFSATAVITAVTRNCLYEMSLLADRLPSYANHCLAVDLSARVPLLVTSQSRKRKRTKEHEIGKARGTAAATTTKKTDNVSIAPVPLSLQEVDQINHHLDLANYHLRRANELSRRTLSDNFGIREFGIYNTFRRTFGFENFQLLKSRVGRDAKCPELNLEQIEIKTSSVSGKRLRSIHGFAEFCRQNTTEGRESALYGYDSVVIGVFRRLQRTPVLLVFIHTESGLEKWRCIVRSQQDRFLEAQRDQGREMPRGRDSIRVKLSQVYDSLDAHEYRLVWQGVEQTPVAEVERFVRRLRGFGHAIQDHAVALPADLAPDFHHSVGVQEKHTDHQ